VAECITESTLLKGTEFSLPECWIFHDTLRLVAAVIGNNKLHSKKTILGRGPSGTMMTMSAEVDPQCKKFLVSNFINYKMTHSRLVLEQYNELLGILGRFQAHLKHKKDELTLVELDNHLCIKESLKVQDNDKPKGNNVAGPSVVNMVEHNNSSRYNDNKGKCKHHDNTRDDLNKKAKPTCWKCGKSSHIKMDFKGFNVGNKANGSGIKGSVDGSSNSLKGQNMFNKSLEVPDIRKNLVSSSILNNCGYKHVIESNKFVLSKHGVFIGFGYLSNQMFRLNIVNDNIASAFMSTSKLNDSILWHVRLGHVHFKRMQDMSKDGLIPTFDMDIEKCKTCMPSKITKKPFQNIKRETKVFELIHSYLCDLHATPSLGNKKYFVTFIDDALRFCYVYLLHTKDEALDKFKVFKTEVEIQQGAIIKRFKTDRGGEYMDTLYFQSVDIIHETTAPYTPQQNGISERKIEVWGCKEVVRLPDQKLKTLGERGIKCIFVGYPEHSKAFRLYVIEPNESFSINLISESRDAIFDENIFSSVPRPSQRSLKDGTEDIGGSVVSKEVTEEVVLQPEPELRKSKKNRTPKNFGPEFQLYLIERTRDKVSDQQSYCFNVEDDPKTFDEAMNSQDVAF
ncbi:zinc finger, CCHC-type containing protein, partial [Tanacetum coccineum]